MYIYLDNSATTRCYDEVIDLMADVQRDHYGNPSSLHTLGIDAERYVKEARKNFAETIGAEQEEVFFTSCGTESDNVVLMGTCKSRRKRGKKVITTAVEHPAVLEPAKELESMGFEVECIGVDRKCRLNMEQLKAALTEDVILISVMAVNNEIGTVMPIEEIGRLKDQFNKDHGTEILMHTDAVQALGKIPLSVTGNMKTVDMMSVSSHKIHGPKGVGGLYVRKGIKPAPIMLGGGQERGLRSGTENTAGIAGFGRAIAMAAAAFDKRIENMRKARKTLLDAFEAEIPDILINSPDDESGCPSVLSVSFLGTRGEVLLHTLEQDNIFVSTGSACSSNKKGQSHVLSAMGLSPKEIEGTIRFSFSEFNTEKEMEYTADKVKAAVNRFRRLGSFR